MVLPTWQVAFNTESIRLAGYIETVEDACRVIETIAAYAAHMPRDSRIAQTGGPT